MATGPTPAIFPSFPLNSFLSISDNLSQKRVLRMSVDMFPAHIDSTVNLLISALYYQTSLEFLDHGSTDEI